jgi:hypothetical protein
MSANDPKAPGAMGGKAQAKAIDPAERTALRGKMVRFASLQP